MVLNLHLCPPLPYTGLREWNAWALSGKAPKTRNLVINAPAPPTLLKRYRIRMAFLQIFKINVQLDITQQMIREAKDVIAQAIAGFIRLHPTKKARIWAFLLVFSA
jgi:hypothetical protein